MAIYLPLTQFYKIWFSLDPDVFLPIMNQLRLVHLLDRIKQSPIQSSVTLLVKKSLLSALAIEAMDCFNQQHPHLQIVDIDLIIPLLTHPDDLELSVWANAEIRARRPESARDLLTAIPYFAHRFGQYFDFDVTLQLNALPPFISCFRMQSPTLIFPVIDKTTKYSFSNDMVFVTSTNMDDISEEDARTCLNPVISSLLKNYHDVPLDGLLVEKCWKEIVFKGLFEKQLPIIRERQMNIPEIHAAWNTLFPYAAWEEEFIKMYHIEPTCEGARLNEWKQKLWFQLRRGRYNNPEIFLEKATDFLIGESENPALETSSSILKMIFELSLNNTLKMFVIDISGPRAYSIGFNLRRQALHYSYIAPFILSSAIQITHRGGSDLSWLPSGRQAMHRQERMIYLASLIIQRAIKSYLKKKYTEKLAKMNMIAVQLAQPISRIVHLSDELRLSLFKTVRLIRTMNVQLLSQLSFEFLLSVSQDKRIVWHAALSDGFFKRSFVRENLEVMLQILSLSPENLMNILRYNQSDLDILIQKMSVPVDLILTANLSAMNFLIKIYREEITLEECGVLIDLFVPKSRLALPRIEFTRWPQFFSQQPVKLLPSSDRYDFSVLIKRLFTTEIDIVMLEYYCEALELLQNTIQLSCINFSSLDELERLSLLRSANSVIYLVKQIKIPYQRLWYHEDGKTKIDAQLRAAYFDYPEKLVWLLRVGVTFNQFISMGPKDGLLLFDNAGLLFHFCPYALPLSRLLSLDFERKKQLFLFSTEYLALVEHYDLTVDDVENLTIMQLNKLLVNVSNQSLVQSILSTVRPEEHSCHCL